MGNRMQFKIANSKTVLFLLLNIYFTLTIPAQVVNFSYGACKYGLSNYNNNDCLISSVQNPDTVHSVAYPNPAIDRLSLLITGTNLNGEIFNVQIMNYLGQTQYKTVIQAGKEDEINLSGLLLGNYIIMMYNSDHTFYHRFSVMY